MAGSSFQRGIGAAVWSHPATPGSAPPTASGQPAGARVMMVHVHDPRSRWTVHAARVARIVSARDWADDWIADPALDVLAKLGPRPAEGDEAHRVIVLRGATGSELAVIAAGAIHISDVDPGDVLPLPPQFTASAPEISAIIVAPDASLSLLLDPLAITTPDAAFVRNHA